MVNSRRGLTDKMAQSKNSKYGRTATGGAACGAIAGALALVLGLIMVGPQGTPGQMSVAMNMGPGLARLGSCARFLPAALIVMGATTLGLSSMCMCAKESETPDATAPTDAKVADEGGDSTVEGSA